MAPVIENLVVKPFEFFAASVHLAKADDLLTAFLSLECGALEHEPRSTPINLGTNVSSRGRALFVLKDLAGYKV